MPEPAATPLKPEAKRIRSTTPAGAGVLDDLLTLPATELAARIRGGEFAPSEVVDRHICRIRAVNPALNALVADRFEEARREARQADERLRSGDTDLPPLLGVPFTVKEMIDLEGMPNTFGSVHRAGSVATADATIVRRLREAGAIPLGVSNVPEWGFWFETISLVYGRARNPYAPDRTPGGSSGGEGALIGAGGSPFGVGSDIGGSIRMPAAFCGVFGHKPTSGLLPLTGHHPVYRGDDDAVPSRLNPFVALGPIARSARDLMPLLRIMAGPDGVDPNATPIRLESPDAVDWNGRRVLVLDDPSITLAARATREVREAVRRVAREFETRGSVLEALPRDFFRRAVDLWFTALRALDSPPIGELVGGGQPIGLAREIARTILRRPRISIPVLMIVMAERFGPASDRRQAAARRELEALRQALLDRLGEGGVLLLPPHPRVAPRHNRPLFRPFDFAFTGIFNALRLPTTVAPVGFDRHGLPLGVQIAAAPGSDHLTIAAALAVEEALGGWRPPSHNSLPHNEL